MPPELCPTCGQAVSDTWRVKDYVLPKAPKAPKPEKAGPPGVPRRRIETDHAKVAATNAADAK